MLRPCLALSILLTLPVASAAQTVVPVNTPVVVTTDGFWIPDTGSSTPLLHVPASAFPGAAGAAGSLQRPAVEWDRDTDSFLVSAGAQLFRVNVTQLVPAVWSIDELTPASASPLDLWDLDLHPGTGELFLLDQTHDEALRFPRPFALGMTPDLALPVPGTSRALAVDSRGVPTSVIVAETSALTRVGLDGTQSLVTEMNGGRGLDADPQTLGDGAVFSVVPNSHHVYRSAANPNLVVSMNQLGFCIPLAMSPEDVEWNPIKPRAFVLAGDGVNPSVGCQSQVPAVGPNHVLSFPVAQAAPVVVPKLITFSGGSGITGTQGDLTLVLDDFAFASPYGASCSLGEPASLVLNAPYVPRLDVDTAGFTLEGGAAGAPVLALAGYGPAATPLGLGCSLAVTPDFVKLVGFTDAQGGFELEVAEPPGAFAGFEAYLQLAVLGAGAPTLSNGLQMHWGE